MKPTVHKQGKTVIQRDGEGWLVMTPEGDIHFASNLKKAQAIADKWARDNTDPSAINVMIKEIRS